MKFCPFLVAGASMQAPQSRPSTAPALVNDDPFRSEDAPAALHIEPRTAAPKLEGSECLGEVCRFHNAGGCRFDALFAAPEGSATAVSAAPATPILEEVWSLQRESLREVMSGFEKLGGAQGELQSGLVTQVDALVQRLEARVGEVETQLTQVSATLGRRVDDLHHAPPHPALVDHIDKRCATLESEVRGVETVVRGLVGESGVSLRAQFEASLAAVQEAVQGGLAALQKAVDESRGSIQKTLEESKVSLQGAMRDSLGSMQSKLQESQATLQAVVRDSSSASATALGSTGAELRQVVERLEKTLAASLEESQAAVRTTTTESAAQLGSLLSRATAETRNQVERGLAKVLEEMVSIRDARIQIQAALDALTRETREVAALARRVESAQVLTHELLDEQRQTTAKLDARDKRERARQLNNAGVMSYHQGAYDASVDHFKQAIDLDPNLAQAYNNLGLSYTEMGRDEEATSAFQRALEIDPTIGQVYNNLGYLYSRRGQLDQAVEMYQRAIQRGADTSSAYTNLANAYYKLKKLDSAVAAWRRAVEIDPANHKALSALERLGLETR